MNKTVLIIRGVSGSGKSSFASYLESIYPSTTICTADDFFVKDGVYNFDASKLGAAHASCLRKFKQAIDANTHLVIQANTNTSVKEFREYEEYAKLKGYTVFHLVMENRHGNADVHNVPSATTENQKNRLKNSIQL